METLIEEKPGLLLPPGTYKLFSSYFFQRTEERSSGLKQE